VRNIFKDIKEHSIHTLRKKKKTYKNITEWQHFRCYLKSSQLLFPLIKNE